jgi:beta-galactosidase
VDENDLVHLGGYPGPLRNLLGLWAEEIDALTPEQKNTVVFDAPFGDLSGAHPCGLLCDRIHAEGTTQVLATYGDDFYAGEPAVTVNRFGEAAPTTWRPRSFPTHSSHSSATLRRAEHRRAAAASARRHRGHAARVA